MWLGAEAVDVRPRCVEDERRQVLVPSLRHERCKRYYAENREAILARYVPKPPRELSCAGCGETFIATNGRQVYCTPGCRPTRVDRGAKVTVACEGCGEPFEARARDRAKGWARFCGKSCATTSRHAEVAA